MFESILVGYDGSDGSRDAVALAKLLADRDRTMITLAQVHTEVPIALDAAMVAGAIDSELQRDAYEEQLERARERLGAEADGLLDAYRHEPRLLPGGSAARALHELVEEGGYDLLVIGSTGRGAIGRVLPGSVGRRLLSGSPIPLAIAPRGFAHRPPESPSAVVVGIDRSEEALTALREASEIARRSGSKLRLATVVEGTAGSAVADPEGVRALVRSFERAAERAREAVPPELESETAITTGEAVEELLELADEPAGLLVLGSRAYGPLSSVLLGSVSARIIDEAPCPVLIVPRGSERAPTAEDGGGPATTGTVGAR